jgi:hypothetical protein
MSDLEGLDAVMVEKIGTALSTFEQIQAVLLPHLPDIALECFQASPEPVEFYLGGWDGTQFSEKLLFSLQPGGKKLLSLNPIQEFTNFKKGESLMARVKKGTALYSLKNTRKLSYLYAHVLKPPVFPWWKGTSAVRWGFGTPYVLKPQETAYSILEPEYEDVWYYFTIA